MHRNDDGSIDVSAMRSLATLGLYAGVVGIARVVQEVAIAWRFGAGEAVDTYYLLLSLLTWLPLVALSVGTNVLVPVELALRQRGATDVAQFRGESLGASLLLGLLFGLLAAFVLASLSFWPSVGTRLSFSLTTAPVAVTLGLLVPLGLFASVLSVWFVATQRNVGTLIEAVPAMSLVAFLVVSGTASPDSLYLATVASATLYVGVMAWLLRGEFPRVRFSFSSSAWQQIRRAGSAMVLGQILISATIPIDHAFAFSLPEGSVAVLNYANRLIVGLLAIVGIAVQRAGLPILTHAYLASDQSGRDAVMRWATASMVLGSGLSIVAALIAEPAVVLIYQRGAFLEADTDRVVSAFRIGLLQTPFYICGMVFALALAAQGRQFFIAVAGAIALIVKVVCNLAFADPYGLNGIQLSTALMYGATCAYLGLTALRRSRSDQASG